MKVNWLAILCAGAAYWVLGYVWYSLLFGKIRAAELARHQGERGPTGSREMIGKLIGTFICNLLAAAAVWYIIYKTTPLLDYMYVWRLIIAAGVGFAGTALTMAYIWESKPTKLWFIDVGYNVVGIMLMTWIVLYVPL